MHQCSRQFRYWTRCLDADFESAASIKRGSRSCSAVALSEAEIAYATMMSPYLLNSDVSLARACSGRLGASWMPKMSCWHYEAKGTSVVCSSAAVTSSATSWSSFLISKSRWSLSTPGQLIAYRCSWCHCSLLASPLCSMPQWVLASPGYHLQRVPALGWIQLSPEYRYCIMLWISASALSFPTCYCSAFWYRYRPRRSSRSSW